MFSVPCRGLKLVADPGPSSTSQEPHGTPATAEKKPEKTGRTKEAKFLGAYPRPHLGPPRQASPLKKLLHGSVTRPGLGPCFQNPFSVLPQSRSPTLLSVRFLHPPRESESRPYIAKVLGEILPTLPCSRVAQRMYSSPPPFSYRVRASCVISTAIPWADPEVSDRILTTAVWESVASVSGL